MRRAGNGTGDARGGDAKASGGKAGGGKAGRALPLIAPAAIWLSEVAKAGSIRKAAARLNLSPSAVNRQILNLEAEVGAELFERLPRGVRLTAAGEVLVAEIRRWEHDQARALRRLSQLRGMVRGHAAIGVMESLGVATASRLMTVMRERRYQISLDVTVGGTAHLIDLLVAGRLDLVICYSAPRQSEIELIASAPPAPGIVVGRGHALAGRRDIRLSDCADYSFVLPDASLTVRRIIDLAFAEANLQPATMVTTNSVEIMKMLVRDHGQIALLGLADVHREVVAGELVHIPFAGQAVTGSALTLVGRRSAHPSPVVTVVTEVLRDILAGLPNNGRS